ncbi:hypothetical protein JHK85_006562 [Glycine max]|uniref:Uncharacterized protein n=1 Tax=Glycine max TaxID=3847 RepID=A0A0R0KEW6_SOYBN|nr:hypothetical protein JHK85_006562 [Glycine max]KAG5071171.1 hypothetical protein JHK86_006382 [Glycine max]
MERIDAVKGQRNQDSGCSHEEWHRWLHARGMVMVGGVGGSRGDDKRVLFAIIHGLTRFWNASKMKNMIYACIILHNMIVEDEHDTYQINIDYNSVGNNMSIFKVSLGVHPSIRSTYLQRIADIHDKQKDCQLQAYLVKHI